MKKDNFYQAVKSIFTEQGHKEAYEYLLRRGYNTHDAIQFMNDMVKEEDTIADKAVDRASGGVTHNSVSFIKRESDEPPKSSGFFSKLFR